MSPRCGWFGGMSRPSCTAADDAAVEPGRDQHGFVACDRGDHLRRKFASVGVAERQHEADARPALDAVDENIGEFRESRLRRRCIENHNVGLCVHVPNMPLAALKYSAGQQQRKTLQCKTIAPSCWSSWTAGAAARITPTTRSRRRARRPSTGCGRVPACPPPHVGRDVGLPAGQMGNSEVGHLNIGAGRVVMQELPRIDRGDRKAGSSRASRRSALIAKMKRAAAPVT